MVERKEIKVVDISTGEVVRRIDVTGKSERGVESVLRGLLTQMDTEKFYAEEAQHND